MILAVQASVLNHDLFSVYAWEYTVMKFAANLNLKEHQFFFTHPVYIYIYIYIQWGS